MMSQNLTAGYASFSCSTYNEGERMIATCSHCRDRGEVRSIRTEFGIWEIDSPRCPNCGAKMDGVE